jgi:hypothetical protein
MQGWQGWHGRQSPLPPPPPGLLVLELLGLIWKIRKNTTHVSSSTPGGGIVTGSVQVGFLALFKQQWRLLAPFWQQKTPRPPLKQQSG